MAQAAMDVRATILESLHAGEGFPNDDSRIHS